MFSRIFRNIRICRQVLGTKTALKQDVFGRRSNIFVYRTNHEDQTTKNGPSSYSHQRLIIEEEKERKTEKTMIMESNNGSSSVGGEDGLVVRARGLPWSCSEEDIRKFFNDSSGEFITQISFTFNREGRPSGEAYMEFSNEQAFQDALMKDHEKMGHRYIEVFRSKKAEMDHVLKVRGKPKIAAAGNDDAVVRLRGLPFGCTKEEIANFFSGLEILPNGITMPLEGSGRASGEAFVQFSDTASADKALEKHMQNIAHRYIEVFRSSLEELEQVSRRMHAGGGYAGGRGAARGGGPPGGSWSSWPSNSNSGNRPGPYDRPAGYAGYGRGGGMPPPPQGHMGSMGYGWGGGYSQGYMGSEGGPGWNTGGYPGGYGYGGYGVPYGQGMWGSSPPGGWTSGSVGRGQAGGGPIRPTGGRGSRAVGGGKPAGMQMGMGGGGNSGAGPIGPSTVYSVKMRGLPYNANENDIMEFFAPLRPARIEMLKEFRTMRPSGEAKVDFYSQKEAQQAMKKDRAHMGTRYIELFLDGPTTAGNGSGASYTDFTSDAI